MHKRLLAITSLLLVTLSLSAIDLDEATTIIKEASEATEGLQNKFDILSEDNTTEESVVVKEKITKVETSNMDNVEIMPEKVIEVTEINETIKETIVVTEVNKTIEETSLPVQVVKSVPTIKEIAIKPNKLLTEDENRTTKTKSEPIVVETPVIAEEIMAPAVPSEINVSQEVTEVTEELEIVETEKTTENNASEEEPEEIEGSVMKGLVIFKTRLKGPCGMTGEEFAKNYTQEDWDDIYDAKEFKKVVIEICPKMEGRYQERWTVDLYQFSLKYASDSDEIPEC